MLIRINGGIQFNSIKFYLFSFSCNNMLLLGQNRVLEDPCSYVLLSFINLIQLNIEWFTLYRKKTSKKTCYYCLC